MAALLLLCACSRVEIEASPTPSPTLPQPQLSVTRPPSVDEAARKFVSDWQAGAYGEMYAAISSQSRSAWTREAFSKVYQNLAEEAAVENLDVVLGASRLDPLQAEIPARLTFHSAVFGELERQVTLPWVLEQGRWRLDWDPKLALPELEGGRYLGFRPRLVGPGGDLRPARRSARIPDRGGLGRHLARLRRPGADPAAGFAPVGLFPLPPRSDRQPDPERSSGRVPPARRSARGPGPGRLELLKTYGSVVISEYSRRMYYDGGSPRMWSATSAPSSRMSSPATAGGATWRMTRSGARGSKRWGEQLLNGKTGGKLYVFNPDGQPVCELGFRPERARAGHPPDDQARIFKREVQKALSIYDGAIVVAGAGQRPGAGDGFLAGL